MGPFEYVMVLVSIVVGLGVTHILSACGVAVHRARGLGPNLRLDPIYAMWVVYVFVQLISFWWWEFTLRDTIAHWTYGIYLLVVSYSVVFYLITVVLIPRDLEGINDTEEYFFEIRPWFFSLYLASFVIDIPDTVVKRGFAALDSRYLALNGIMVAAGILGLFSRKRWVNRAIAGLVVATIVYFMFAQLGVLK